MGGAGLASGGGVGRGLRNGRQSSFEGGRWRFSGYPSSLGSVVKNAGLEVCGLPSHNTTGRDFTIAVVHHCRRGGTESRVGSTLAFDDRSFGGALGADRTDEASGGVS